LAEPSTIWVSSLFSLTRVHTKPTSRLAPHPGLQSYAIKHYEACLKLAVVDRRAWELSRLQPMDVDGDEEDEIDEPDDFARLAAYNLSSLYMLSGSADLARIVARRWLAV
jgi:general transcription factor 3C polypeptide 3 (transcription factor C subunit 4)